MTKTIYKAQYNELQHGLDLGNWYGCQVNYDPITDNYKDTYATAAEAWTACEEWRKYDSTNPVRIVKVRYNGKTGRVLSERAIYKEM